MGLGRAMGRQRQLQYHLAKYHFRFYDINSLAITISFIACISSAKYAMVTDGNRETNLVAMVAVKANSVSIYLIVIVYHMLNNVEKEKLVIDLYYNQRKNVRQIAQEARMSFRDIAAYIKGKGDITQ